VVKKFKKRVYISPVFSTIGELCENKGFLTRDKEAAVFGKERTRANLYDVFGRGFNQTVSSLGIKRIFDIGEGDPSREYDIKCLRKLGVLPVDEVSYIFSKTMFGFIYYPTGFLSKSSVFAAYASHGIVPLIPKVCFSKNENCGLSVGKHFIPVEDVKNCSMQDFERVSKNIYSWYQSHNVKEQAEKYYGLFS